MSAASRLTPADRETVLLRLAELHDDNPADIERALLRCVAHPALDDEALELAWTDLLEAVTRSAKLRDGALEPYDIDDRLTRNNYDAAEQLCHTFVDEALYPLLNGWTVGLACRECRRTRHHVYQVRAAMTGGRGLCASCAIAARGHQLPAVTP